jgi:hypothetical protein
MSFITRLREGTYIRILVFLLYKFIFLIVTLLTLALLNPLIVKFIGIPFRISVLNLFYFFGISSLIDIAKYLVFQGILYFNSDYEESYFWTDKILRIFLDTGNNTIYIFVGSILHYLLFLVYVGFFDKIPKEM